MQEMVSDAYEYVDLGLPSGRLWCTANVGAASPTEIGLFFSWGNTDGHVATPYDGYSFTQNNYNTTPGASLGTEIPLEQDAAYVNMGTRWRMATHADYMELNANCSHAWINVNGVNGMLFTSNINGKTLFFPAAGVKSGRTYTSNGYGYYYKGDNPYVPNLGNVNRFVFSAATYAVNTGTVKWYGHSVRAVIR